MRYSFLIVPTVLAGLAEWLTFRYAGPEVSNSTLRLIALGVIGVWLACLDLLKRLTEKDVSKDERWYRAVLPAWCVVPFAFAVIAVGFQHYHEWQRALDDIEEVAGDLRPATPAPSTEQVNDKLAKVLDTRFAVQSGDDAVKEKQHFTELARVIAHDLRANAWNPERVRSVAERDTLSSFLLALAVQALFVLWIPLLLAVAIFRASRELQRRREDVHGERGQSADLRRFLDARDRRILAEDNCFFIPRLCFATLLVLGTNYVFAPFGLKASYVMALVDEHALPGHPSWAFWSTSFGEAPVIVIGFVGFLFYALITATQRFMLDDLDDQAVFSLLARGLVVVLLSLALSASPLAESISGTFVFIAGVFPARALAALAKKANVALDPDFSSEAPSSFQGLPSLDPTKVFALRAVGIQSTYDLAAMRIQDIAERVRIDPRLLGRTVDRAILVDAIGAATAAKLDPFGITSATELVDARNALPQKLVDDVGNGPKLVADRLAGDARVDMVRDWLSVAALERPRSSAKEARLELGSEIEDRLHALANMSELDTDDPQQRRQALREALTRTVAELGQKAFLCVDVAAFGVTPPVVKLFYAAYDSFDELTDDIFYKIKVPGRLQPYEYGRQWELRRAAADPTSTIPHARMTRNRGWGIPVDDPTPLDQLGIKPGETIYAVPLRPRVEATKQ